MDHAVKLTINGETREFPMGITYKEVVKAYEKTSPAPVILVIAGGKICELHKKAERDGEVRLVTTKDSIGNKTYKRKMCIRDRRIHHISAERNRMIMIFC